MRKMYKISGIDCAHCAATLEDIICKVPGVKDAKVNFILEKMVINADDEAVFAEALAQGKKAFPDFEAVL